MEVRIYATTDIHLEKDAGTFRNRPRRWRDWFWLVDKINKDQPDLFIDLGDMTSDYSGAGNMDLDRWLEGWNNITVPKIFVPGNHETRNYSHDNLAVIFGVDSNPVNGNEKFNTVHSLGDIDFLMLSANYNDAMNQSNGYITASTFTWIETVLLNTDKSMVVICSHYGAHRNAAGAMSQELLSIVEDALENNPSLEQVKHIFGHRHESVPVRYANMGNFIGYNIAAGDKEKWNTIKAGSLTIESFSFGGPHPQKYILLDRGFAQEGRLKYEKVIDPTQVEDKNGQNTLNFGYPMQEHKRVVHTLRIYYGMTLGEVKASAL